MYLCPENNKENIPPSCKGTHDDYTDNTCSESSPDDLSQSSGFVEDDQLSCLQSCATLSSMNSGTPKIKVESDDLISYDGKSDFSISPLIPLEPNFKAEDYLFSLDSNEGIADLFDVDSFL